MPASLAIVIPETSFSPPRGGGALRVFHLLKELGRHFETHAITGQSAESLRSAPEPYRLPGSIRIHSPAEAPPPRDLFDRFPNRLGPALRYRWHRRSLHGPANGVFLAMQHLLRGVLESEKIDLILFEHLESMTLSPMARRISPRTRLVLDAHNLDHRLVAQAADRDRGNKGLAREAARLERIESNLASEVDAFLACSEADRHALAMLNKNRLPGFTIPNGVDTLSKTFDASPDKRSRPTLLFCGSLDYTPNRDGLLWFHDTVWPRLAQADPALRLRVIGRGNREAPGFAALRDDASVDLIGEVADLEAHYRESSLCVVPLRMGSGTRLKILEAMAYGCPVVSTRLGAEGIDADDGVHLRLADEPAAFANAILRLRNEADSYELLRNAARQLVETRYDWSHLGEALRDAALSLINA